MTDHTSPLWNMASDYILDQERKEKGLPKPFVCDDDYIITQLITHVDQANPEEVAVIVRYIRNIIRDVLNKGY